MRRAEKTNVVEKLAGAFRETPHVLLADYRGLDANQATELRRKIRAVGGRFQVIKNRLTKRAAVGTAVEKIAGQLTGPCAIASHTSDPVGLAKVLVDFGKENPQLRMVSGVIDARDVLDGAGIQALSELPGLPELRARLLATVMSPATTLVRLVATPGTQIARVLDARCEAAEGGEEP